MEVADVVALARAGSGAGETALAALAASPRSADWATQLMQLSRLQSRLGVDELFFELMQRTRYLEAFPVGQERDRVTANVSRFAELVDEYCERRPDHSLRGFLEHIDLVMLSGLDEELPALETAENALQLMTIHQAKGLEFEAVFIPSLVEGRLPQPPRRDRSESSFDLPPQLLDPGIRGREDHYAEERRLCYVAMTRARRHLWLSWAARYEGPRSWQRSRFLDELEDLFGCTVNYQVLGPGAGAPPAQVLTPASPSKAARAGLDRHLTLSFSAVSAYRECPRRYWLRYEQRLPAPPSVEGQFGTVVHDALRRAGRMRREGEVNPEQLRQAYAEAWAEIEPADPRRRPALAALGWAQLERYHAAGGFERAPYLVEQAFTAELETWSLRGVIDRVDAPVTTGREQDGEAGSANGTAWRLIDYKTGTPLPATSLRRDLQLALYALGAKSALQLSPLELEIVYLQTGRSVVLPAPDELVQEAMAVCEEVAAGIRDERFEARPERRRCRLCPYRMACREGL
jgi:DNA helicase-2/ATP-dependent DNA helicase PcrA